MAILGQAANIIKAEDDIANHSLDMSDSVRSALTNMTVGFGEFLGNMLAGSADINGFGTFIAMSFADLSVTVGKQMIALGFAGIALRKFMLTPGLALAAGIALVAAGTFAKSKISAAINGGGGAAEAASGGGGGSGNYNYDSRANMGSSKMQTVNVVVSGELRAQGAALVTVFNQENKRLNYVT
jgi:hypothetical protein